LVNVSASVEAIDGEVVVTGTGMIGEKYSQTCGSVCPHVVTPIVRLHAGKSEDCGTQVTIRRLDL
jgi:hypothetical protein